MQRFRFAAMTVFLLFAALAAGCGNKGDLVKPTPPADSSKQTPAAPADKPAQDATQH